ncbi:MAG: hemerythrin domain-containing protein [Deltaproteobacteria bacterium]|jgi:hemerythrin-like domain-containing protein|nr:hemerythrin domain-containing protein [Deltaproteobacteria bacterium]
MSTESVGAQILSEHKDLRGLLRGLEQQAQRPVGSRGWVESVRAPLSQLADRCSEHFRLEEQAGLHVQLRDQSPRLAFKLERLLSEHGQILEVLSNLVGDLSREAAPPGEAEPLKERVLAAVEAIREHERAENEAMMDAYWEDLGGEAG